MSVLKQQYKDEIVPALFKKHSYENIMEVPRLTKVVISTGIGSSRDRAMFDEAVRTFGDITGQRPVITKARISVANFKLREGMNVGVRVTLRGSRMYDFIYRLNNIALPQVRDFRGVSPKSFDGFGNYSFGLTDQSIFTEINLDQMKHTIGMNITIVTTAKTNEQAFDLLSMLGTPFVR